MKIDWAGLAKDALKEGSELLKALLAGDTKRADEQLEEMRKMGHGEFSRAADAAVNAVIEGFWGEPDPPMGLKCPACAGEVSWAARQRALWIGSCGCPWTCWRWDVANPKIATKSTASGESQPPRSTEHREVPVPLKVEGRTIDVKFETGPAKEE